MNPSTNPAALPPSSAPPPRQLLKETLNICFLYGIMAVGLQMVFSMLSLKTAEHYILFYLLSILSSLTASLLPALVLAYIGRGGIRCYLVSSHPHKTGLLDSFLLVLFGLSACVVINMLCTILESYWPAADHKVYLTFAGTFGNFLLMLTASAIVPAICEEIPCRGYLYASLAPYGHLLSVLISSFIFGMMHSSFSSALFAFCCGFLFGCIRKTSNRFLLAVIVHFLNNALSEAGLFLRMAVSSTAYLSFLRITSQAALFICAGCIYWLYRRKVKIFHFRPSPFPLTKREKLRCVLSSPVLWLFIIAAVTVKLL